MIQFVLLRSQYAATNVWCVFLFWIVIEFTVGFPGGLSGQQRPVQTTSVYSRPGVIYPPAFAIDYGYKYPKDVIASGGGVQSVQPGSQSVQPGSQSPIQSSLGVQGAAFNGVSKRKKCKKVWVPAYRNSHTDSIGGGRFFKSTGAPSTTGAQHPVPTTATQPPVSATGTRYHGSASVLQHPVSSISTQHHTSRSAFTQDVPATGTQEQPSVTAAQHPVSSTGYRSFVPATGPQYPLYTSRSQQPVPATFAQQLVPATRTRYSPSITRTQVTQHPGSEGVTQVAQHPVSEGATQVAQHVGSKTGSRYPVAATGVQQLVPIAGTQYSVYTTRAQHPVSATGTKYQVPVSVSQYPVLTSETQHPVSANVSKYPVPATGAQHPVTGAQVTQYSVSAVQSKYPVPATAAQYPVYTTTAHHPVIATRAQHSVPATGAQHPVSATGAQHPVPASKARVAQHSVSTIRSKYPVPAAGTQHLGSATVHKHSIPATGTQYPVHTTGTQHQVAAFGTQHPVSAAAAQQTVLSTGPQIPQRPVFKPDSQHPVPATGTQYPVFKTGAPVYTTETPVQAVPAYGIPYPGHTSKQSKHRPQVPVDTFESSSYSVHQPQSISGLSTVTSDGVPVQSHYPGIYATGQFAPQPIVTGVGGKSITSLPHVPSASTGQSVSSPVIGGTVSSYKSAESKFVGCSTRHVTPGGPVGVAVPDGGYATGVAKSGGYQFGYSGYTAGQPSTFSQVYSKQRMTGGTVPISVSTMSHKSTDLGHGSQIANPGTADSYVPNFVPVSAASMHVARGDAELSPPHHLGYNVSK